MQTDASKHKHINNKSSQEIVSQRYQDKTVASMSTYQEVARNLVIYSFFGIRLSQTAKRIF